MATQTTSVFTILANTQTSSYIGVLVHLGGAFILVKLIYEFLKFLVSDKNRDMEEDVDVAEHLHQALIPVSRHSVHPKKTKAKAKTKNQKPQPATSTPSPRGITKGNGMSSTSSAKRVHFNFTVNGPSDVLRFHRTAAPSNVSACKLASDNVKFTSNSPIVFAKSPQKPTFMRLMEAKPIIPPFTQALPFKRDMEPELKLDTTYLKLRADVEQAADVKTEPCYNLRKRVPKSM